MGYVCDVELDFASGCIKAVILPERFHFFPFIQKNKNKVIPWENIVRVGEDILLVNIPDFINAADNISKEENKS